MSANVMVGDRVWFVPGPEHWAAKTQDGKHCFRFVHDDTVHPSPQYRGHRKGDEVADLTEHGMIAGHRGGKIITHGGREMRVGGAAIFWPARVVAVNADGSVDLDVAHPIGWRHKDAAAVDFENTCVLHHIPLRSTHPQAPGVKYDKAKGPHTYHLVGD